jgi:hypothetical protein
MIEFVHIIVENRQLDQSKHSDPEQITRICKLMVGSGKETWIGINQWIPLNVTYLLE